ncbi:CapA family protein [Aneurinibacillus sp. BA2021]|nr:CapA family protein [Aneurinibacillus sp. BA2021]
MLSIMVCAMALCAVFIWFKESMNIPPQQVEAAAPAKKAAISVPVKQEAAPAPKEKNRSARVLVSAVGDVTIGTDEGFAYAGSFPQEVEKNGYAYFGKHISSLFMKDDITIANLETTLTTAKAKAVKTFRFKGTPEYARILTLSGIDTVNLANNHTHDYLQKGYDDTVRTLAQYGIGYFGYAKKEIRQVKGVSVGLLGYEGWENTAKLRRSIAADIEKLRQQGAHIVIVSFHWGVERSNHPNTTQRGLGQHAIRSGADLVLGHHPHVMQGIEQYHGKYIVYSLGNFMFGGNRNPSDKDTFIFQQMFHVQDGKLADTREIRLIPASISSVKERNNYQPVPLSGAEGKRVLARLKNYTDHLGVFDWHAVKEP